MSYLYGVPKNVSGLSASDTLEGLDHLLPGFTGRQLSLMTEMGLEAVPEAYRMRSSLTISSLGRGADSVWSGVTFGLYVYQGEEEGVEFYKQHHTVDSRTSQLSYIYRGPDQRWRVGWTLGGLEGFLHNQSTGDSPPSSGWRCNFGVDWREDPELTVSPGVFDICGTVSISGAERYPQCNGDYTPTGQFSRGVLVFKHSIRDLYLVCQPGYWHWWVTDHLRHGDQYIRSAANSLCPGHSRAARNQEGNKSSWMNIGDGSFTNISVVCSRHTDLNMCDKEIYKSTD